MNQNIESEKKLTTKARALYLAQCDKPERELVHKLNAAKNAAINSQHSFPKVYWLAPAAAMSVILAIGNWLPLSNYLQSPELPTTDPLTLDAIVEFAETSTETLDQDVDFYLWLADAPIASDDEFDLEEFL